MSVKRNQGEYTKGVQWNCLGAKKEPLCATFFRVCNRHSLYPMDLHLVPQETEARLNYTGLFSVALDGEVGGEEGSTER